ncbi:MAG: FAD-dependent oxidoreductase, partial [Acidobacteriaceae bacterium]
MRALLLAILGLLLSGPLEGSRPNAAKKTDAVDLVVYGGTAAGVMTAYSAAREGLHVVLLQPGTHLGGMVTGGLSATDLGHYTIIGGYARDFYMKAAGHYGVQDLDRPENWRSEPHVDEEIFRGMLQDAGVVVHFDERLREQGGVTLDGKMVTALITEDGKQWPAKMFADCSYEGDLMGQAKVSYTWGRESSAEYGEDLAGVREHTPKHQFLWPLSAYNEQHQLLPEIDPGPLAPPGSGDKKVQAYNFRLILTNDPGNRLPFPRPQGYDRSRFALLERYLKEFPEHMHHAPGFRDLTNPVAIPEHKADFNNNGPVSTDYIGHSWKYPEASYAERTALWNDHLLYTESFFYFLSQDK